MAGTRQATGSVTRVSRRAKTIALPARPPGGARARAGDPRRRRREWRTARTRWPAPRAPWRRSSAGSPRSARHAVPRDEVESVESRRPNASVTVSASAVARTSSSAWRGKSGARSDGAGCRSTGSHARRSWLAHELARESERDGAPAVRREDDRSGEAADPLLDVGPARHRPPARSTAWYRGRHPSGAASAASVPARARPVARSLGSPGPQSPVAAARA